VSAALRQMRTNQIGRLPVVDEKGTLKGIVSLHNLINNKVGEGKRELGDVSSPGENLFKTMQAVTNRYNGTKATGRTVPAKKTTLEEDAIDD
jgi:CBS-domain-containing membrane protein